MTDLAGLIERLEGATKPDRDLNETVAKALGWQRRLRTSLGLNGRTPGRWGWVDPVTFAWKATLPDFTGPRKKTYALCSLRRALQASTGEGEG